LLDKSRSLAFTSYFLLLTQKKVTKKRVARILLLSSLLTALPPLMPQVSRSIRARPRAITDLTITQLLFIKSSFGNVSALARQKSEVVRWLERGSIFLP
jgi:hypothetical protein